MNILQRIVFVTALLFISLPGYGQVENVVVEKYYISDSLDATDTTLGRSIPVGAITYRVYIKIKPGSKVRKIYGDANHPLVFSSTAPFYNNIDRPAAFFGYLINKSWYTDNPALALDSWLSLGQAAKNQSGVLKTEDTNGNLFAGALNGGGTALVSGGILQNSDPAAGVPLTTADGLMPDATILSQWLDYGFRDPNGIDTSVFGSVNTGALFYSTDAYLQQNSGVIGGGLDSTFVLVAQLTTAGELEFRINLELEIVNGSSVSFVNYVAQSDTLLPGEVLSPFLTYPPACGCMDPSYLEYSAAYSCTAADSCKTLIRFGCMDTAACNYDPSANFNIISLCCYPGICQDRDIAVVCPELNNARSIMVEQIFPVPAADELNISLQLQQPAQVTFEVMNITGNSVMRVESGSVSTKYYTERLNTGLLSPGMYYLRISANSTSVSRKFIISRSAQ